MAESRELLIDEMGMVSLPPDLLLEMGGPGRWVVDEVAERRLVLESAEDVVISVFDKSHRILSLDCPACKYEYDDENVQSCPECGATRPLVKT